MKTCNFTPGAVYRLADGTKVLLLNEFRVVFGSNLSSEEAPIDDIAVEAAAIAVVQSRYPDAEVEAWNLARTYRTSDSHGWLSTPFYAAPGKAFAGYVEWRFKRLDSDGAVFWHIDERGQKYT